jgi:hypothetical protein
MQRFMMLTAALFGVLAAAMPAHAGWIIDQVVKTKGVDANSQQRLFLQANRLKVTSTEGTRTTQAMVMDLDAQTITQIDYQERTFTTATAKEYADLMRQGFQAMGEQMGQMKELEEQLKNLPPEQRRAVEAMLKQAQQSAAMASKKPEECMPDKVDVKSTGKRVTVAGYDASGYQVFSNGDFDSEVFIAPGITAAREIDPKKLERMVSEMMKALPQCPARGRMFGSDPMWKLMKDGYPVRSVGKDGATTEVVKAESRSLGANEFEPPTGFARKPLKEMMGGR